MTMSRNVTLYIYNDETGKLMNSIIVPAAIAEQEIESKREQYRLNDWPFSITTEKKWTEG